MAPRLELQAKLKALLGSPNVYYDPKPNVEMVYPCVRYELDDITVTSADNKPHFLEKRYQLMVIDQDKDSAFVDKIMTLPKCRFSRYYSADNLHHYIFNLSF